MKILHVMPTLGQGGAERLASELIARSPHDVTHHVVSMTSAPAFFPMEPARVETLGLRRGAVSPSAALAFRGIVRRERPDVIHGWLYHGNALASLARSMGPKILWSIHNTSLDRTGSKRMTRLLNQAAAMASPVIPHAIVYCAEAARTLHEGMGYARRKGLVIENGVDLGRFRFKPEARDARREELGLARDAFVIGQFGRLDPQKGIPFLLGAFGILSGKRADARLLLAGDGLSPDNRDLASLLNQSGLAGRVLTLGPRSDIADLLSAIDCLVIASTFGEAMPMIALEAAAIGLPIVTTNVGEAGTLGLSPNHVVPAADERALAAAISAVADGLARDVDADAKERRRELLQQRYDIAAIAERYVALYRRLRES